MVASATRAGNPYYLKYQNKGQNTNIAKTCNEMLHVAPKVWAPWGEKTSKV